MSFFILVPVKKFIYNTQKIESLVFYISYFVLILLIIFYGKLILVICEQFCS